MLKEIRQVVSIVVEEAGRRRWVSALKVFAAVISFIGFSIVALDPLLRWLFPSSAVAAWVIIVTVAVVITLLVTINFMLTFNERALGETRAEWDRRDHILKKLYALSVQGRQLEKLCEDKLRAGVPLSEEEMRQVDAWHRDAAARLEDMGIEYRRRFYDHSPTGEAPPPKPGECANWINVRNRKIAGVIRELRLPPPRLITEAEAKQYEETGFLAGRVYDGD
jgi:hypothetical protein